MNLDLDKFRGHLLDLSGSELVQTYMELIDVVTAAAKTEEQRDKIKILRVATMILFLRFAPEELRDALAVREEHLEE